MFIADPQDFLKDGTAGSPRMGSGALSLDHHSTPASAADVTVVPGVAPLPRYRSVLIQNIYWQRPPAMPVAHMSCGCAQVGILVVEVDATIGPLVVVLQASPGGSYDAFVAQLTTSGVNVVSLHIPRRQQK